MLYRHGIEDVIAARAENERNIMDARRTACAANGQSCALTVEWMMIDPIEENIDVVLCHNPSFPKYSGNEVGQNLSNPIGVNQTPICSQVQAAVGAWDHVAFDTYETLILDVPSDGITLPAYYKWLDTMQILQSNLDTHDQLWKKFPVAMAEASIIAFGDIANKLFYVRI
jgi:hypothetical protein